MEGDDPFADLDSMGGDDLGGEDELGGDEELDIGGDEITLSLPRDLAEKLISRHVIYPRNRQFISKIIYHGKIYNLMINNLDFDEKKALNYNETEIVWAKK